MCIRPFIRLRYHRLSTASSSGPIVPLPADGFRLAKLHGSINWYYSGAESFFGETIYDVGIRPEWGSSTEDKFLTKSHYVLDKVPLLVPPTSSKNAFFANEAIRGNWRSARSYLEDAEEVVVIGYSTPASDLMARGLLSATSPAKVTLVDIDTTLPERYKSFLKGDTIDATFVRPERALESYIEDLPSARPSS